MEPYLRRRSEPGLSPSLVRQSLARLLASPHFRKSPGLSRLLTFLVEHQLSGEGDLKETLVGHVLYGRAPSYDPKADSVVRVNANRLRARLLRYYHEHPHEQLRIELHPGSYTANFQYVMSPPLPSLTMVTKTLEFPLADEEPDDPRQAVEPLVTGGTVAEAPVAPVAPPPTPDLRATLDNGAKTKATWRWFLWGSGLLAALCALLAFLLYPRGRTDARPDVWTLQRVDSMGAEQEFVTLSKDQSLLAFSWHAPSEQAAHIYLRDMATGSVRRLTTGLQEESRPAFTPDGKQLAFVRLGRDNTKEVILFSLHDGHERKLIELTGTYPWLCHLPRLSFNRDGSHLYTSASLSANEACGVVDIDVASGNLRRITQPSIGSIGDVEPAVAPDGSGVAFLRNSGEMGGDIFLAEPRSGALERLTFDNRDVMGFTWMPQGDALVVASRRGDGISRLWRIPVRSPAPATSLTDGSMTAGFPSVNASGDHIYFTAYRGSTTIWQIDNGRPRKVVEGSGVNNGPQLSPNGKLMVYRSDRTGAAELWLSRLDGSRDKRLTYFNGPMVGAPRWALDGHAILFECRPQGSSQICTVNPDGSGSPLVLTHWSANQIFPSWAHDGKSFYFTSNDSGRWEIYQQRFGGAPVQLTHKGGMRAIESPQGDWLYVFRGEPDGGIVRLALRPSEQPAMYQAVTSAVGPEDSGNWDVSRDGLVFLHSSEGLVTVRELNPDTGQTRQVVSLPASSPGGELVFSSRPETGALLFVKQEQQDGEIDTLIRKPEKH